MAYTIKQIAAAADRGYETVRLQIKELTSTKKFVKKSPGKQFSKRELQELEELLDFKYIPQA